MHYNCILIIFSEDDEDEMHDWELNWRALMTYIRNIYRMAMDGDELRHTPPDCFKETAYE